jgi:hypothetical protein
MAEDRPRLCFEVATTSSYRTSSMTPAAARRANAPSRPRSPGSGAPIRRDQVCGCSENSNEKHEKQVSTGSRRT